MLVSSTAYAFGNPFLLISDLPTVNEQILTGLKNKIKLIIWNIIV